MTENILHSTTQKFLDIFDITNNMVILKDGTCSLIIQVDAMNFGLLAEEEQDSIMYSYAGLLNSLNYPIQIIVHSQTKDVTGYLQILKDQEDQTQSRTQQQRIRRYREFVSNLIRERNVLDKKFYVAISATAIELGIMSPQSILPGQSNTTSITGEQRTAVIEKARNLLEPKRDHLLAQFARIGLFARQLATQEIIQFFYVSYNPEAAEGQQIADTSNYTTPMVTAGVEGVAMNNAQDPTMNNPVPVATAAAAQLDEMVGEGTLPSPVPEPAAIPPQLAPDAPVTPPSEITIPSQTQTSTVTQPTTQSYTPTQMVSEPPQTPSEPAATMSTSGEGIPTVTDIPVVQAETPSSTEVTPPVISPEPTSPIAPPESATPVEPPTPMVESVEPIAPTPATSAQTVEQSQPTTSQTTQAEPKATIPGPTIASMSGSSDLPKPTLPPMQPSTTSTPEEPPTPMGAVMDTTSPAEIEPIEVPSESADPTQSTSNEPVSDQKAGADLPPLPEI